MSIDEPLARNSYVVGTSDTARWVILGAHTSAAESLVEVSEDHDLGVDWVRSTTSVELQPELSLMDPSTLTAGGYVVAFDDPVIEAVLEGLGPRAVTVVDLRPASEVGPAVFSGLVTAPSRPTRVRIPVGPAHPILSALSAIGELSPRHLSVVALESASRAGRPGIDELSEQTRAFFTLQDRSPVVFDGPLAFNVRPAEDGPDRLASDLEAGATALGLSVRCVCTRLLVPTFSTETAVVQFQVERTPAREDVIELLGRGLALRVVDAAAALDASGRDDVLVTQVAVDRGTVSAVLHYDRLRRGSATQVVWLLERWAESK